MLNSVLCGLVSFVAAPVEPISIKTLLPEMADLGALAHRPSPWYREAQSSSYDRNAFKGDPFANGDAGQYDRVEQKGNRKEYVLADLKGPGTVVRLWSANPSGVIRFYFDGETSPRLQASMADLLSGKVAPFVSPFAYPAAQGTDMYFPLPYAKSLKVTVDDSAGDAVKGLYYHVGYRTYAPSTAVRTFTSKDLKECSGLMSRVASALTPVADEGDGKARARSIAPGASLDYALHQRLSSAVTELRVHIPFPLIQSFRALDWDDPHEPRNVLRSLILKMKFDGEETVRAPLGDFFGTVPGVNAYRTLPFEVRADGTMICRLVMPFRYDLSVQVQNIGKVAVPVTLSVKTKPFRWDENTYLLHTQWVAERGSTRPMRDMHFLDVAGEGRLLGSVLHVTNPTPAWWGEGDEKFYVDGETRPSTFGTGTEDYYGYAWCSPQLFAKPYHAQTHEDGPANFGHTSVQRWHIFDSVPFQNRFRFDLEMWHWADVIATYARTTYWYAKPGTTAPAPLDPALLLPEKVELPHVKGALEGESVKASATGGTVEVQRDFAEPSGAAQLWWRDAKPGDRVIVTVPVPEEGTYEVSGSFCHARDYGIHRLSLNGESLGQFDFFGDGVKWKVQPLGKVHLPKGDVSFVAECTGHNPLADPRNMFGLDYLKLDRVP